jgi:uncharacterized protein
MSEAERVNTKVKLRQHPGRYVISKLDNAAHIPPWADGDGFVSISRTPNELSIVCPADRVPEEIDASRAWACFELLGPFAFDETGIALSVIEPLSEDGIGVFLVATFDTDYLLVQEKDLAAAKQALTAAGHTLVA